ncbi:MAG: FAD binding domain-containing protein, partial [Candidatus Wallbacteria bacterium]|nr:FAD binding domain-containing protein [Candidatus Wallbacteria bacterium]
APAFIVLGASVRILSSAGELTVPLAELYEGDGIKRHVLRPGELILSVELPPSAQAMRGAYLKLRLRDSFDYPEMGLAVALAMRGEAIGELRVAATAVDTVPLVFDELTSALAGQPLTPELIDVLVERVTKRVTPVKNTALSPNYRRRMVGVFLKRMLVELGR